MYVTDPIMKMRIFIIKNGVTSIPSS